MFRNGFLIFLIVFLSAVGAANAWAFSCAVLFGGSETSTIRLTAVDRALAELIEVLSATDEADLHRAFPGLIEEGSRSADRRLFNLAMEGESSVNSIFTARSAAGRIEGEPDPVFLVLGRAAFSHPYLFRGNTLPDGFIDSFGLSGTVRFTVQDLAGHARVLYDRRATARGIRDTQHADYLDFTLGELRNAREQVYEVSIFAAREVQRLKWTDTDASARVSRLYTAAVLGATLLREMLRDTSREFAGQREMSQLVVFMKETGRQVSGLTAQIREMENHVRGFLDVRLPEVRDWQLLDWLREGMIAKEESPPDMVAAANLLSSYVRAKTEPVLDPPRPGGVIEAAAKAFRGKGLGNRLPWDGLLQFTLSRDGVIPSDLNPISHLHSARRVPEDYKNAIELLWFRRQGAMIGALLLREYRLEAEIQGLGRDWGDGMGGLMMGLTELWMYRSELTVGATGQRKKSLERRARELVPLLEDGSLGGILPASLGRDLGNLRDWAQTLPYHFD